MSRLFIGSVALCIVGSGLGIMAVVLFPKVHFEALNSSAQVTIIIALFMLILSIILVVIDAVKNVRNKRNTHGI